MIIPLKPVQPRECGPCTLCCRVMAIKELAKPPNVWCQHAKKGRGCQIYATRPGSCQGFECLWLSSTIAPLALRPDKVHGVLIATLDGHHIVLHEDPGYPGVAHAAMKDMLTQWIADGTRYYVVACGKSRKFYGNQLLLAGATAMLNEVDERD